MTTIFKCEVSHCEHSSHIAHARAHGITHDSFKKFIGGGNRLDRQQLKRLRQILECGMQAASQCATDEGKELHEQFQTTFNEQFGDQRQLVGAQ